MANSAILKALGLNISPNSLDVPDGSLAEASNIVIRRDNVIESRRGFKLYGDALPSITDRTKQLLNYKNRILRHYSNILQWDDGAGSFTNFTGNYSETQSGLRIKSVESNGNFYFTTSEGIKKLSVSSNNEFGSSVITNAGGIKAIDLTSTLETTLGSGDGFLPQDSAVAYRIVWGTKDSNNNLILGVPSQRNEIYNSLENLLLLDFNNLLSSLDNVSNSGSSLISDNTYVSTLALSSGSSPVSLRTQLIALATKIDNDIVFTEDSLNVANPGSQRVTSSTAKIKFTASVINRIKIGDKVKCSSFSNSEFNTRTFEVTNVTTDTIDLTILSGGNFSGTDGALQAETGSSTVQSITYQSLTQPSVPNTPATNDDLIELQTYFDTIVSRLQGELSEVISTSSQNDFITPIISTTSSDVKLTFTIPEDITTDYFYQIYRSDISQATATTVLSDLVPNDEMKLVYEAFPTSSELSALEVSVIDVLDDLLRGVNLYTNEATGEGSAQTNERPPFAKDINRFKNSVFYANTKTRHKLAVSLIGTSNILNGDKLTIATETGYNTYTFVTGVQEVTPFTCTNGTGIGGKYITFNSANDEKSYYLWFNTGASSDPALANKIGIETIVNVGDTATIIAEKSRDKINSIAFNDFSATANTGVLTITNNNVGYCTDATIGNTSFVLGTITQGVGENVSTNEILLSSSTSPAVAIDETSRSLVRVINKNTNEIVYAYYISGVSSVPGKLLLESRDFLTDEFCLLASNSGIGDSFNPSLSPDLSISSISIANPTVITTSTSHGLQTGDRVVISGSDSTPSVDGIYLVTKINNTQFSIPVNVTVGGTVGGAINASLVVSSENDEKINRVYYSKLNQPEAVPSFNYFDVGASDKEILRIMPLRDTLFIFKEDGLYRISGESIPFTLSLFDSSCLLIAPDSLGISNNLIYGWTTQGISAISEAGVSPSISRPIDTDILRLASSDYVNFSKTTWGVGYDSDNSYLVFVSKKVTDTNPTICYRYSNLTNTWTTYDKTNTCGIINHNDDKLYLGAGDINYIEQERKSFSRYDYTDRQFDIQLLSGNYFNDVIQLNSVNNIEEGDVLVQQQYLTVYEFNILLKKLDMDNGVADSDYFSILESEGGDNLRTKLEQLTGKLDSDTGVNQITYFNTIDTKTGSITSISTGSLVSIVSASHGLSDGRLITISGSDSTPDIDGDYEVTVIDPNTFSISVINPVLVSGSSGTFSTDITDSRDLKACYNAMVRLLNADIGVSFSNYSEIDTVTIQEAIVSGVDKVTKRITLNNALEFIQGSMTIYKAIKSTFTYTPMTFGDPLNWKHLREATVLFKNRAFTSAKLAFATDLLPQFIEITFNGEGNGIFGHTTFGNNFFGWEANSAPFRTYVPRFCQRCRYIVLKYTHRIAREQYAVYGVTLTGENIQSSRAYR